MSALTHDDSHQLNWELVIVMNCTFRGQSSKIGFMGEAHFERNNKNQRVNIYVSLLAAHRLARQQYQLFLSQVVAGGEKCCLCAIVKNRRKQPSSNRKSIP